MNLNAESRAFLAQKLLDSLDRIELEDEWISLAEKRLSEIEDGRTQTISWNEIKGALGSVS